MTDREEKMLNQLTGIGIALDVAGYHADAQCVRDAIAMLMEQKPVPVESREKEGLHCRCPNCGRRVVWEVNADGRT